MIGNNCDLYNSVDGATRNENVSKLIYAGTCVRCNSNELATIDEKRRAEFSKKIITYVHYLSYDDHA